MKKLSLFVLMTFGLFLLGCTAKLQEGLTEKQANKIISVLKGKGITAQKMKDPGAKAPYDWTIMVDSASVSKAIPILHAHNLPPKKVKGLTEIYGGGGMKIPTDTEERAKYQMALAGELVKTFKRIHGIVDARVHLVIPKPKILQRPGQKQPQATASVLLITHGKRLLIAKADIQKLVAGSVEGLQAYNVKVVTAPHLTFGTGDASADAADATVSALGGVVKVAKEDAMKFRILVGVLTLLVVIFLALFIWSFMKSSSLKNQLKSLGQG